MTASKASNLPLLLPWFIAFIPALRWVRGRLPATIAVGGLALLGSLFPQMWMNTRFAGEWSGVRAENGQFMQGQPAMKLANNTLLLTIQNFVPPLFPFANQWNARMKQIIPNSWRDWLEKSFEPAGAHWALNEMESEEYAGLGF